MLECHSDPAFDGTEDCRGVRGPQGVNTVMELSAFKALVMAKLGVKSERGANMVEYVLILTLIALVVILVVTNLGSRVSTRFSSASSALS